MTDGWAFHTPDYDGSATIVCRSLALPSFLWPLLHGAIGELLEYGNWHQFGSMQIDDVVQAIHYAIDNMRECPMIGSIMAYARPLPDNVLLCDGSVHSRIDYPELYDVIDPSLRISADEFVTPDLSGRFVLGEGGGHLFGETGGSESHTLTVGEMPAHTHGYVSATASLSTVVIPDEPSAIPSPSVTEPEGGGQPHNNMPPFFVVRYGIIVK